MARSLMATKRSRKSELLLDEGKTVMCGEQIQLSASFSRDNKQRKIVSAENGNPSKGLEVTGQELVEQPEKQTGKNILELGLPVINPVDLLRIKKEVGDFLEACSSCKKKLHGKDVFMYGNHGTFCSTECRSLQIISDGNHVKFLSQSDNLKNKKVK